jgi:hypothetical protein
MTAHRRADVVNLRDDELTADERDDVRQFVSVALAGIQRERAAADAHYLRGRNVVTFAAAFFVAVQAALVANIGKETKSGQQLLERAELGDVLWPAGIGALLLLVSVAFLLFWLDRARPLDVTTGDKLEGIWQDRHGQNGGSAKLLVLLKVLIEEEKDWSTTNESRRVAGRALSFVAALAALSCGAELSVLLLSIR